uniref:Uncharacterized protein n=1 Tax=Arundo donax TaxID=35708 RepID=A0A0A9DDX6_ARUDO
MTTATLFRAAPCSSAHTRRRRALSASPPPTSTPSPGTAPSTSKASKMMLASLAPAPTSSTTSFLPWLLLAKSSSSSVPLPVHKITTPALIVPSLWLPRQRGYLASLSPSIELLRLSSMMS